MMIFHFPFSKQPAARPDFDLAAETPLLFPLSGHTAEALKDRARSMAEYLRTSREVAIGTSFTRRQRVGSTLSIVWRWSERATRIGFRFGGVRSRRGANQPGDRLRPAWRKTASSGFRLLRARFPMVGHGSRTSGLHADLPTGNRKMRRGNEAACRLGLAGRTCRATKLVPGSAKRKLPNRPYLPCRSRSRRSGNPGASSPKLWSAIAWARSQRHTSAAILSFEDAVKVICHRGRLMQSGSGLGKMAAIELPARCRKVVTTLHQPGLHRRDQ